VEHCTSGGRVSPFNSVSAAVYADQWWSFWHWSAKHWPDVVN